MDVCFVARRDRVDFVESRVGASPGSIVDVDGHELGRHDGVARFTIGQRRGLGVAAGERRYVVDVDAAHHTVTVGPPEALLRDSMIVEALTFTHEPPPAGAVLHAQLRAHGAAIPARLHRDRLEFLEPTPRVAPGQVVALYDGDVLVGGGVAV
jgi:tRNA-specific 2-thiouridylase